MTGPFYACLGLTFDRHRHGTGPEHLGAEDAGGVLELYPATAAAPAGAPGGVTLMPAQLAPQVYGCYLMDADRQTLCVYSYKPGEHDLHLEAARDVEYDRLLKLYNTSPPPTQVQRLADRAAEPARALPPPAKD